MCNSFNTRPRRYPYHCCNGVLMPPCILRARTRQLVIHLIYSTGAAADQAALASCWRPERTAGHSAAFVLQRWSQGHVWFYHGPEKHHPWCPLCSRRLGFHEEQMWETLSLDPNSALFVWRKVKNGWISDKLLSTCDCGLSWWKQFFLCLFNM